MGSMKWTADQKKVIDLRKRNILVSAAAGSGKTAVLVERIIAMITRDAHPADIDRLLIVTFTNAAAGEMRERIGAAIEKELKEKPENEHLQKQMSLVHSAKITTVHSFCLDLLRNHFNAIDLDPGFRLGDEAELKLLKSDVLEELLEDKYEEADSGFLQFVESYATGKSDSGLEDMVLKLFEFSMSYPRPGGWLTGTKEAFSVDTEEKIEDTMWMNLLFQQIHRLVLDAAADNSQALAVCREGDGPYMYEESLEQDEALLIRLSSLNTYEEYERALGQISWSRLSAKKDGTVDKDKREWVKELRNGYKASLEDIKKQFFFQPLSRSLQDIQLVRRPMEALVDLTMEFARRYREAKEEKNILDFDDLEHFALKILLKEGRPTLVAQELSEAYEEILIDEYQDSNHVQETLLNSISRERLGQPNLFMVGDVKQSIYKFRLARPELFMEKLESYTAEESLYQRISLRQNFRSRKVILDSVNCIFEAIMHKSLGNVEYDKDAALYLGASFPDGDGMEVSRNTDVLLVAEGGDSKKEINGRQLEAEAIVVQIRKMKEENFHVVEQGEYRPVKYSDMVVLLRSMSGWADEFISILGAEGIPAYADTSTGYFSATEVRIMLEFLRILDNPLQDIPFTAVLSSPIVGLTYEELGRIRSTDPEEAMYDCVQAYVKKEPEGQQEGDAPEDSRDTKGRIRDFLEIFLALREQIPYTSVYDLLQEIYRKTNYYHYVSVLPDGVVRRGNLDMLLQKAADFEKTSYHGLFHFNRYIEKLHKYEIDFGEAGAEGRRDAVRIMSIHKSKGLEFPVVFVAGMGKQFNQQDARNRLILHPDLGLGPDYVDFELRTKTATLLKKVIQRQTVLENLGEELRVLYVAFTRAKEKLVLVGSVKDVEKKLEQWGREKADSFRRLSHASSYYDWIMPVILSGEEKIPPSLFQIETVAAEDLTVASAKERINREVIKNTLLSWKPAEHIVPALKKEIDFQLHFVYPYEGEAVIKSKLSVSELKHRAVLEETALELIPAEEEAYVPSFLQKGEETTGAARGTLYHRVLECMDFTAVKDKSSLEAVLKQLCSEGKLEAEDLPYINRRKLLSFLTGSLGSRMRAAAAEGRLWRERPFVMGIPAKEIYVDTNSEEIVVVQGIIDAYFQEGDALVLADYKTDRVDSEEMLRERYREQLAYYKRALEQITGKKVKEAVLYSFGLEAEVKVEL